MVHLCTAREYAHDISAIINCPEFYLGSISPDAIHMRKDANWQNKRITHLHADGEHWKDNVLDFLRQNKAKSNYKFLLGYGIHILTDILWNETIYSEFKIKYERDSAPTQDITWAYYNDTDQLDFELYKKIHWREEVWNLLEKAKPFDIDDILSAEEIKAWNERTLHWYDSGSSYHKHPIKYISYKDITDFAQTAGKTIRNTLAEEGLSV